MNKITGDSNNYNFISWDMSSGASDSQTRLASTTKVFEISAKNNVDFIFVRNLDQNISTSSFAETLPKNYVMGCSGKAAIVWNKERYKVLKRGTFSERTGIEKGSGAILVLEENNPTKKIIALAITHLARKDLNKGVEPLLKGLSSLVPKEPGKDAAAPGLLILNMEDAIYTKNTPLPTKNSTMPQPKTKDPLSFLWNIYSNFSSFVRWFIGFN